MRPVAAITIVAISAALVAAGAAPTGALARSRSGSAAAFPSPTPTATGATISGRVTTRGRHVGLPGMLVQAVPADQTGCATTPTATDCGPSTYSGLGGAYSLSGLAPGTYTLQVLDGSASMPVSAVTIDPSATAVTVALKLPAPSVPDATVASGAGHDLRLLNAERARDGLAGDVALNPRWSAECAAHDAYEADNDTLTPAEDPASPGASPGGAWAGLNGVLAQGRWTSAGSPWEDAPVHLMALLAPSLSVTGIDDTGALQCAITFPGMLRAPARADTVTTVPDNGADNVPTSETAHESPFTPVQFAGLPTDRPTGRELFVYLNRAGVTGQSPVTIVRASLRRGIQTVPVRWVDTTTRTLGPYLAGAILIPVDPLRGQTTYRATVVVREGTRTLIHSWSFSTH